MKILVIEDNPADVEFIRELLSDQQGPSFEILHATTLSSGLSCLSGGGIDVVLLDLGLPDSQGTDTVRAVRECPSAIPIVVLTGLDDEETGVRALQEGAQDYLVKGEMSGSLLVRSIRYGIERNRAEHALRESEETACRRAEELETSYEELEVTSKELETANEELRQQRDNLAYLNRLLHENEEQLQLAQQAGRMGSFHWNALKNYTRRSPEIQALYGLKPNTFEGGIEDWIRVLHPEDRPGVEAAIRKHFADRDPDWHCEYRIVQPDGEVRWIEARATIRFDEEGHPLDCTGFNIDISERKRAEEALVRRTEELIRLNREVETARHEANMYLDIITHDVRNANNVSSMYADLLTELAEGNLKTYVEKLHDSIERSSEILKNVATIRRAQAESGRLVPVNLDAVIREEIGNFPGLSIRYLNIPVEVLADSLLPTVFNNLIGNAVKFGGRDIEIAIRVEGEEGTVLASVEDTGPGVPDEMKEAIFRRFERGMHQGKGDGLGLFIVRTLVERYGGRVWIEDRVPGHPEEGAAFRFVLRHADRT